MKLIVAIIQPSKLEAVKEALTEVEVFRLTVMDCQGFGRQKGQTEVYRGHEFTVNLLRKVQLQIAVNDDFVEPTVNAIIKGGRSSDKGEIGDGKIFILPMDDLRAHSHRRARRRRDLTGYVPMPSFDFSRRRFLASTATACAAASCGLRQTTAAEPVSADSRIRKAVKYQMIKEDLSVLDKFKLLADLGFDGTEIHVTTKVDRNEVRKAIEATGVVVHGFLNSSKPDLKYAIDSAKFYGATSVLVVAGRVDGENAYDQVYRQQQDRIKAALPYAEKMGVRLLIENVWNNFLLSPLEMARFIDEMQSPAVGAYFDVGNVVRFGWPAHWIRNSRQAHRQAGHQRIQPAETKRRRALEGISSRNRRRRLRLARRPPRAGRHRLHFRLGHRRSSRRRPSPAGRYRGADG